MDVCCGSPICANTNAEAGSMLAAALKCFVMAQCFLTEPWPPQAHVLNGSYFDFIIIGAGTAGAVVAARLSEMTDRTVLLLEAGGDPPVESIVPGLRGVLKGSRYDWNFTTEDDQHSSQALRGGRQRQPRGKMLGGSGSLNDMVYSRGFAADYHEWASIAGDDWDWPYVLEYFMKTEQMTDHRIVNNPELMKYHGIEGEIEVSGTKEHTYVTRVFLDSFEELGFKIVDDMTNPKQIGAGRFSHTIKNGRRDSSVTALLNKAGNRPNLFILKNTLATKILIEHDRAYGVKVVLEHIEYTFGARMEVIVSAGTFNTPKLLMLSGIGPKDHLTEMGIDVLNDLPVGDNLHDHVMVPVYLTANAGTCSEKESHYYMNMISYLYSQGGPLSESGSMGAYMTIQDKSKPNVPDFAVYPTCVPIKSGFYDGCTNVLGYKEEICRKLDKYNQHYELLSLVVVLLHPKSRGMVRLQSTDPSIDPLIYSGTFSNTSDLKGYPEAMKRVMSLKDTSYFRQIDASVVHLDVRDCPFKGQSTQRLECTARSLATSAWHACGTASMGSVLDSELRVKGVVGLRVVDASAIPVVPRGNTNAPVVMLAEKAADYIKRTWK